MIIIIILFLCCCFTIIISKLGYDSYKDYTELDNNEIKSFNDFKDFLKFIFDRIVRWIKCNFLGIFYRKYRQDCFTGAVILSKGDEARLDSAEPGNLDEALWMLRADQARQTEDYLRANEALDGLENAIVEKDAAQVFDRSDEVEMDEEALYWRAWITAQTSQMTHNLVNMEICNASGNVVDYMDLAATGLDKQGNRIPDNRTSDANDYKSGKDFRWSNRCKNRSGASLGYEADCAEPDDSLKLIGPGNLEKYWINEKYVRDEADNGADPQGVDTRTDDIDVFNVSDFSGYNCNFYAKHFCKDGKPDYDNHSDMFGMMFNWPELNCCACGGGSRQSDEVYKKENDNKDIKHNKYEVIYKNILSYDKDYLVGTYAEGRIKSCNNGVIVHDSSLQEISSCDELPSTTIENMFYPDSDNRPVYYKPKINNCGTNDFAGGKHGLRLPSSAGNSDSGIGVFIYKGNNHSHVKYCINDCDEDDDCAGVIYDAKAAVEFDKYNNMSINPHYFDNLNMMRLKESMHNETSQHTQVYNIGSNESSGSCHYIKKTAGAFGTDSCTADNCISPTNFEDGNCIPPEEYQTKYQEELDNLFNRNFFNRDQNKSSLHDINTSIILKKMGANFQNLNKSTNTIESEHIDEGEDENRNVSNDHEYDMDYDVPIKSDTFGDNITTCSQLCENLDNYKVKSGEEQTPCPPDGCKRSVCCELNTCGNSGVDCNTTANSCTAPDGTEVRCGPNYSKNNNILCEGECTTEQCCYKSHCSPPGGTSCLPPRDNLLKQPLYFWDLYNRITGSTKNIIPKNTYLESHTDNHILGSTDCYGPADLTKAKYKCADHGDSTWKLTPHEQCPEGLSMTQDCTQKNPGTEAQCSHYGEFTYTTDPRSINSVLRCVDDPNSANCTTGTESSYCTALPPYRRAGPEHGTNGVNVLTTKMNINRYLNDDDPNYIWNNAHAFCNIYRIDRATGEVPEGQCVPNGVGCGGGCGGPGYSTWSSITVPPSWPGDPPSDEEFREAKKSLEFS